MTLFDHLNKLNHNIKAIRIVDMNEKDKKIFISFPLTAPTSKARIKRRSAFCHYGEPVAVRKNCMTTHHYLEWQISYDGVKEKEIKTNSNYNYSTLKEIVFTGHKGKNKVLFELSEIIYYFYQWNVLKYEDIEVIIHYLSVMQEKNLLDNQLSSFIARSLPIDKNFNNIQFKLITSSFPILIYEYSYNTSIIEIIIKEKQRAIGIQPMLYYCFPISMLVTQEALIGRSVQENEIGFLEINNENIKIFLEIMKIFGILSSSHHYDIVKILEKIIL